MAPTINQLIARGRKRFSGENEQLSLHGAPFRRGVCLIVRTQTSKTELGVAQDCPYSAFQR